MELLPISALQHLLFCERQCALIHVERIWAENRLTAEGRALHEAVDRGDRSCRSVMTVARDVALCSERLGLYGRADVVEYRGTGAEPTAYPVEYKRGKRRPRPADDVQLCAQAMCLEEMLGREVPRGAVFHAASRRRRQVEFAAPLRAVVEETARRLHTLVESGLTPRALPTARCRSCSLVDQCLPAVTSAPHAASLYLAGITGP